MADDDYLGPNRRCWMRRKEDLRTFHLMLVSLTAQLSVIGFLIWHHYYG